MMGSFLYEIIGHWTAKQKIAELFIMYSEKNESQRTV